MNKFNVILALGFVAMVAFVACAQAQQDQQQQLVNELDDDIEVDDELEGGGLFGSDSYSQARKKVGISAKDEWGRDVLDANKGIKQLNERRTPKCKGTKNEQACKTCCQGDNGKAGSFNALSYFSKKGACTCYDRDNAYATGL